VNELRRTPILDVCVRAEFHTVLLVSVYLLFAGHNQPGGGFVGGLVAGSAFVLRYVAGGVEEVRQASRVHPYVLLGSGLLLSMATVVIPLAMGQPVLDHATWSATVAVLGTAKTTSALFFDTGVYLVVVGLVLILVTTLGAAEVPSGGGAESPETDEQEVGTP
jgi:multisubunit Na+/H+ antiporter MnhB subunit